MCFYILNFNKNVFFLYICGWLVGFSGKPARNGRLQGAPQAAIFRYKNHKIKLKNKFNCDSAVQNSENNIWFSDRDIKSINYWFLEILTLKIK